MTNNNIVKAWFDGSCDKEGYMGVGAIVKLNNQVIFEYSDLIEPESNCNSLTAEYHGMLSVLNFLHFKGFLYGGYSVTVYGDSKNVIDNLIGKKQISNNAPISTVMICKQILAKTSRKYVRLNWIPREWNQDADQLSRLSMKEKKETEEVIKKFH
jgi:ribonuclease HI